MENRGIKNGHFSTRHGERSQNVVRVPQKHPILFQEQRERINVYLFDLNLLQELIKIFSLGCWIFVCAVPNVS